MIPSHGERQRVNSLHELPTIAGGSRLAQPLQVGAVEHVDTQDRLDEIVNGVSEQIAPAAAYTRRFPK